MKVVDTREYLSVLRELVQQGNQVNLLITGNSMSPFLAHQRDTIYFSAPKTDFKKGDIVFYQRDNGDFVVHRICKIHNNNTYDIIGDAHTIIEHGIRRDQIFARVDYVKRKGKQVGPGDFWWEFFSTVWIRMIPLRPFARKGYSVIVKFKQIMNH